MISSEGQFAAPSAPNDFEKQTTSIVRTIDHGTASVTFRTARNESEHQKKISKSLVKDSSIPHSVQQIMVAAGDIACNPANADFKPAPFGGGSENRIWLIFWLYRSLSGRYGATHTMPDPKPHKTYCSSHRTQVLLQTEDLIDAQDSTARLSTFTETASTMGKKAISQTTPPSVVFGQPRPVTKPHIRDPNIPP